MIIADFVTVTAPQGNGPDLRGALADVCLQLPDAQTCDRGVRVGRWGLLRYEERHGVAIASASGMLLTALRSADLLTDYCCAVSAVGAHRVTQLHAAKDLEADAPSELKRLYGLLRLSGIKLTRKAIPPHGIKAIFSPGTDGRDTGSIMCGHRGRHETTLCIYDRQDDARAKGKPDPGPLLRYELRTSVPGLTLRDVCEPQPLFHHFTTALLPRPTDVPAWAPHGEGFAMTRRERSIEERLQTLVDNSGDLTRMLELAAQVSGDGMASLVSLIRRRDRIRRKTLQFEAMGTAARGSAQTPASSSPTAAIHYDA